MGYELSHTKRQVFEIFAISLYMLFASWFVFTIRAGFTEYILIFALPPLVYLLTRLEKYALRTLVEAAVFAVIFVFGADILAHMSGTWVINGSLGYKIFQNTYLDNFIWAFLYVGLMLAGYQYFFDRYKTKVFGKKFKYFAIALLIFNAAFVVSSLLVAQLTAYGFGFFYASIVLPMILFTVAILSRLKKARHKILMMGFAALVPSAAYEWVSLSLGHWKFHSSMYLLVFNFFGFSVPLEEFLWFFFATTSLLCLHELLVDDGR
jgi:hypothetical protein